MKQQNPKNQRKPHSPEEELFLIEFGKAVRQARKARDWSQETTGFKVGSSRYYISEVELGKRTLCSKKKGQLMKALGFTCTMTISLCSKWVDDDSVE